MVFFFVSCLLGDVACQTCRNLIAMGVERSVLDDIRKSAAWLHASRGIGVNLYMPQSHRKRRRGIIIARGRPTILAPCRARRTIHAYRTLPSAGFFKARFRMVTASPINFLARRVSPRLKD